MKHRWKGWMLKCRQCGCVYRVAHTASWSCPKNPTHGPIRVTPKR